MADKGDSTDPSVEAELRRLREDNEALRYSSQKFAEIADRLAERVRSLERLLEEMKSDKK